MSTIVRFFQEGGAFMIPILLVFGFGIAIAIERWTYLTMSGASNRALWKKIVPFLKAGNFQEAAAHTAKSKAAIGSILTYGLYRVKSARRRDDIEKAMEESLMEVLPRLEKRTHYIATLANIATLAGPAGYDYRPDRRVYGGCRGEPCREGRHAVGVYFDCDEHHGFRSDGSHSAAADSRVAADEDKCTRGQPRDGQRQVPERGYRTSAEDSRSVRHDPQPQRRPSSST